MAIDRAKIHSILVIKLRNIGDVLLSTPVFANLRAHFPAARICALVNGETQEMLTGNPAIDRVFVYERGLKKAGLARKISGELALVTQLRQERFDLVINLTEGDRGAIVAFLCRAKVRVGIDAAGRGMAGKNRLFSHLVGLPEPGLHTVEQNLRFLAPIGVPVREVRVTLACDAADRALVSDRLAVAGLAEKEFFHAHLTSRWMFKTMPPATAARLIDMLAGRTGLPAVFTAAPVAKERAYLQEILALSTAPRLDLGGALTLKQLGALAGQARFFVGVDSAPMHMAAAVGTPVLGIFGPSTVAHWGPWDNRLMVNPYRAARGLQSTGLNLVLQAADSCVPCSRDGCNGSKTSACLDFPEADLDTAVGEFMAMICYDRRTA